MSMTSDGISSVVELGGEGKGVAFLNCRWGHHARRAGYHLIAEGMGREMMPGVVPGEVRKWVNRLAGAGWVEQRVVRMQRRMMKAEVVVVSGGDQFAWGAQQRSEERTWKLVGVFHKVEEELGELVRRLPAGVIDGAVCVARSQVPLMAKVVEAGRSVFIPHGVDTGYFVPGEGERDGNLVICVGEHLRDFEMLAAVTRELRRRRAGVCVRIIGPARMGRACQVAMDAGCEFWPGISDGELLENYQRAAVQLLPLRAATANNSLLEGMACGLPVVTTDLGGVRDYVSEGAGVLCGREDVEGYVEGVMGLLEDQERWRRISAAARRCAEGVAWPRVRAALQRQLVAWGYIE